jgi:purine-binding chemotaxis protein CheW
VIAADSHISARAAELKRAFDRTFAEVQHFDAVETEDFISIRVGGDPYVLRLPEIGGLSADKRTTSLPSGVAALKGIAGFRGAMVPVYDLAELLHYPPSDSARWMVMAAAAPVALAFDGFGGHLRFPREAIASHANSEGREHVSQIVRAGEHVHSIIHLPSVIAAIGKHVRAAAPKKEQ